MRRPRDTGVDSGERECGDQMVVVAEGGSAPFRFCPELINPVSMTMSAHYATYHMFAAFRVVPTASQLLTVVDDAETCSRFQLTLARANAPHGCSVHGPFQCACFAVSQAAAALRALHAEFGLPPPSTDVGSDGDECFVVHTTGGRADHLFLHVRNRDIPLPEHRRRLQIALGRADTIDTIAGAVAASAASPFRPPRCKHCSAIGSQLERCKLCDRWACQACGEQCDVCGTPTCGSCSIVRRDSESRRATCVACFGDAD